MSICFTWTIVRVIISKHLFFPVCLSDGSTWTPGSARPIRPLWHSRLGWHWCECPLRFAQQLFPPQRSSLCWRSWEFGSTYILGVLPADGTVKENTGTKELCSQLIEGSLRACVTVMWYMQVILRVKAGRLDECAGSGGAWIEKKKVCMPSDVSSSCSIPNQEDGSIYLFVTLFHVIFLILELKLNISENQFVEKTIFQDRTKRCFPLLFLFQGEKGKPGSPGPPVSLHHRINSVCCCSKFGFIRFVVVYFRGKRENQGSLVQMGHQGRTALMWVNPRLSQSASQKTTTNNTAILTVFVIIILFYLHCKYLKNHFIVN